jgi:hypothetical protein
MEKLAYILCTLTLALDERAWWGSNTGRFTKGAGRTLQSGLDAMTKRRISDRVWIRGTVAQSFSHVYLVCLFLKNRCATRDSYVQVLKKSMHKVRINYAEHIPTYSVPADLNNAVSVTKSLTSLSSVLLEKLILGGRGGVCQSSRYTRR